jgi:hypothetical protein
MIAVDSKQANALVKTLAPSQSSKVYQFLGVFNKQVQFLSKPIN